MSVAFLYTNNEPSGKEIKKSFREFPGGPMVKNPPSSADGEGLIPGWGTKIPHATEQLSPRALEPTHAAQLESLHTAITESTGPRACALQPEKAHAPL